VAEGVGAMYDAEVAAGPSCSLYAHSTFAELGFRPIGVLRQNASGLRLSSNARTKGGGGHSDIPITDAIVPRSFSALDGDADASNADLQWRI
jgi:hypothetical protein